MSSKKRSRPNDPSDYDVITLSDDEVPSEADVQHTYSENVELDRSAWIPSEIKVAQELVDVLRKRSDLRVSIDGIPKGFVNHEGDKFGFFHLHDSIDVVQSSCENEVTTDEEEHHIDEDDIGVTCPEFHKLNVIHRLQTQFGFVKTLYLSFDAYLNCGRPGYRQRIYRIVDAVDFELEWCIRLTRKYFKCLKDKYKKFRGGMPISELLKWITESVEFVETLHDHAVQHNIFVQRC